jgi:hypothetical protein
MLIAGPCHQAIFDHEREVARRLSFDNVRQAMKALADLDTAERGSDALGYEMIRWNARVRRAACDYLRDRPIETGRARADDLQDSIAYWRECAEQQPDETGRRMCLNAAAEAADELSAQLADLAKMMLRGAAA